METRAPSPEEQALCLRTGPLRGEDELCLRGTQALRGLQAICLRGIQAVCRL
jgi:hypothetical protein